MRDSKGCKLRSNVQNVQNMAIAYLNISHNEAPEADVHWLVLLSQEGLQPLIWLEVSLAALQEEEPHHVYEAAVPIGREGHQCGAEAVHEGDAVQAPRAHIVVLYEITGKA